MGTILKIGRGRAKDITLLLEAVLSNGISAILGALYLWVGFTWIAFPTENRLAGIQWLAGVTEQHIGWIWIVGGTISLVCSLLTFKYFKLSAISAGTTFFTPMIVATVFFVAWVQGVAPNGIVTAVSYASWAITSAWVTTTTSLMKMNDFKEEDGMTDVDAADTGESE